MNHQEEQELQLEIDQLYEFVGDEVQRNELVASIREKLKLFEQSLMLLDLDFDLQADSEKSTEQILTSSKKNLERLRAEYREALLVAKKNKSRLIINERELLLSGALTPAELRSRKARKGDVLVGAAQDATEALRETTMMMSRELKVSIDNVSALEESSRLLRKSKEQHESIGSILDFTKRILTELERADWVDRILILLALLVFGLVAFTIIWKRIYIPGLSALSDSLRSNNRPISAAVNTATATATAAILATGLYSPIIAIPTFTMQQDSLADSDSIATATTTPASASDTIAAITAVSPSMTTDFVVSVTVNEENLANGTNEALFESDFSLEEPNPELHNIERKLENSLKRNEENQLGFEESIQEQEQVLSNQPGGHEEQHTNTVDDKENNQASSNSDSENVRLTPYQEHREEKYKIQQQKRPEHHEFKYHEQPPYIEPQQEQQQEQPEHQEMRYHEQIQEQEQQPEHHEPKYHEQQEQQQEQQQQPEHHEPKYHEQLPYNEQQQEQQHEQNEQHENLELKYHEQPPYNEQLQEQHQLQQQGQQQEQHQQPDQKQRLVKPTNQEQPMVEYITGSTQKQDPKVEHLGLNSNKKLEIEILEIEKEEDEEGEEGDTTTTSTRSNYVKNEL